MRAAAAAALLLLVRAPAGGLTSVSVATGTGTGAAAETGATGIGARDSLPGRVDRLGVYFQNVTHSSAVVRWHPPAEGGWKWPIQGYRLRYRSFLRPDESPPKAASGGWRGRRGAESGPRDALEGLTCVECGCTSFGARPASQYMEWTDDDTRFVASNGIPPAGTHAAGMSSTEICSVSWNFTLPLRPSLATRPKALPQIGVIGVAVDGVPLYSARHSDGSNAVRNGASCFGQAGQNGAWHYQQDFECGSNSTVRSRASVLIGWALDGFPIYGALDGNKSEVDARLDLCNGRHVDGSYRYHARTRAQVDENASYTSPDGITSNWNYLLGCFAGTPSIPRISMPDSAESLAQPSGQFAWGYMASLLQIQRDQSSAADEVDEPASSAYLVQGRTRAPLNAREPHAHRNWTVVTGVVPRPASGADDSIRQLQHALVALRPDTMYYVQIQAYNLAGAGAWSQSAYALHTHAVPDKPTAVLISGTRAHSLTLQRYDPRTRGTMDCPDKRVKNVSRGICTTWGRGSPVLQYIVSISTSIDGPGSGEDSRAPKLKGCMDPAAKNYNPDANEDEGNCVGMVVGCGDPQAFNYDSTLNVNVHSDDACVPKVYGCTDSNATNYNATANTDDKSCYILRPGCTNPIATNWDRQANSDDGSCIVQNVWIGQSQGTSGRRLQAYNTTEQHVALCASVDLSGNASSSNVSCTGAGGGNVCAYTAGRNATTETCVATASAACTAVNMSAASAQSDCVAAAGGSGACTFNATTGVGGATCVASATSACSAAGPGGSACASAGACTYHPGASAAAELCKVSSVDFVVTVSTKSVRHPRFGMGSSLAYLINGQEYASLNLTRGRAYRFALYWDGGGHPFYFTHSAAGGGGSVISAGVNGSLSTGRGIITFTPGYDMPTILYYHCFLHQYMGASIALHLDPINYPKPDKYPPCLETCWMEQPPNNQSLQISRHGFGARIEPFLYGQPNWQNFGSVCNWLASVMWNCVTDNTSDLVFSNATGCEHVCMRNCASDVHNFALRTAQACHFGCDGNARTGATVVDACGLCNGDGSTCSGCMDTIAKNYDPTALVSDGRCQYVEGCMDTFAVNYNPLATLDKGCQYPYIAGCHAYSNPYTKCANLGFSSNIDTDEISSRVCAEWQASASDAALCASVDLSGNASSSNVSCTGAGGGNVCAYTAGRNATTETCVATASAACTAVNMSAASAQSDCVAAAGGSGACTFNATTGVGGATCVASATSACSAAGPGGSACASAGACTYHPAVQAVIKSCTASRKQCKQWTQTQMIRVNSTGCPDHPYSQTLSCIPAFSMGYTFIFPKNPSLATKIMATATWLDKPVGVAINGVPIFNGGDVLRNARSNASRHTVEEFDSCRGQVDSANRYQYRQMPLCLLHKLKATMLPRGLWDDPDVCPCGSSSTSSCGSDNPDAVNSPSSWPVRQAEPSPLLGWALDGFAIYGPYDENGNLTSPATHGGELDECNGRMGADGRYRYHLTPSAPYTVGCFSGTPGQVMRSGPGGSCDARGWTSTYAIPAMPSCTMKCMPFCLQSCLNKWGSYVAPPQPFSGLLSNSWGHLPPASRIYHVPAFQMQYTIRNLDPCTRYAIKITDINAVGRSQRSEEVSTTTSCRPRQPDPVIPLEVTSSTITLQWNHAETHPGAPITRYRLFVSQRAYKRTPSGVSVPIWVAATGSNDAGDRNRASQMFVRYPDNETPDFVTKSPNVTWNLRSSAWVELKIPSVAEQGVKPWIQTAAQQFTVRYLEPAQAYKFRMTAINDGGESFASYDSIVINTLDAEITQVQIFAGMPCVPEDASKVPFHAVSDGTNVQYAWRTSWGGSLGQCVTPECAAMTHSFGAIGTYQAILYASNSRGFIGQIATLDVRMCGCPDPVNSNYWFASQHVVPRSCDGYAWDDVDKALGAGDSKHFSFPLIGKTFGARIIVRIDVGEVDIFISNTQVPNTRMNATYQKHLPAIKTFAVIDLDYDFLYDNIMQDLSKRLFITVVGSAHFSRFDIFAMRRDFTRGRDGPVKRRNLDSKHRDMLVPSGYYDFWEFYFPKAQGDDLVDVTIQLTVAYGCVTVYVSKYERYPSPLRAHGGTYGHDASASRHACAVVDESPIVTVTFTKDDPNIVFISVWGGKVYESGSRPPMNGYDIEGSFLVVRPALAQSLSAAAVAGQAVQPTTPASCSNGTVGGTRQACELTGHTYTAAVAGAPSSCSDGTIGGTRAACIYTGFTYTEAVLSAVHTSAAAGAAAATAGNRSVSASAAAAGIFVPDGVQGEVHFMGWQFFEVKCNPMAVSVTVEVQIATGRVSLYARTAARPSRGLYDHVVHDDDGDSKIKFRINFNRIGATGTFHVGLFGEAGGVVTKSTTAATTNTYTIKAVEDAFACNGMYSICSEITSLQTSISEMDTVKVGKYLYYVVNLDYFSTSATWDNSTGVVFEAHRIRNLFEWTAPLSVAYIASNFDTRIVNTYFNVTLLPVSVPVSKTSPVTCVLYGSTDDPFPGHLRTYDTWLEYRFDTAYKPGSVDEPNYASLMLPSFTFSGKNAHFSVTCDAELAYKVTVNLEQFNHGAMLSADIEQRSRLCPGQTDFDAAPCSGHGTCIDEGIFDEDHSTSGNEVWSTAAAVCHCDGGWVGVDCSIERYPAKPYVRIVTPMHMQNMAPSSCAPCVNTGGWWENGEQQNGTTLMRDLVNMTNQQFYETHSPYRMMYQYDDLTIDSPGSVGRLGCPPCGRKGVQIMYEVRAPTTDCAVVAYVDGQPHAATAEGDKGLKIGNTTHRLTVVNLESGPADSLLPHTIQLFLTFGKSQTPIASAFAKFFVSMDPSTCPNECSAHGVCHHGYCVCFDGWNGEACDQAGGQPPWGFEPFKAYSNRIAMRLDQEMADEAATSSFVASRSADRLRSTDAWLQDSERTSRTRLDNAAAHNRKEMQKFLSAQSSVKAAQASQDDIAVTDWSAAFAQMDRAAQELLDLASVRTKVLEVAYDEVERRLAQDSSAKELKVAQLHSVWNTAKKKSAFNLHRLKTMNGPRVPIGELEKERCTSDRLHNIECAGVDASADFQQGSGYVSSVYRDPYDQIVIDEQTVEGLYSDVPR